MYSKLTSAAATRWNIQSLKVFGLDLVATLWRPSEIDGMMYESVSVCVCGFLV